MIKISWSTIYTSTNSHISSSQPCYGASN